MSFEANLMLNKLYCRPVMFDHFTQMDVFNMLHDLVKLFNFIFQNSNNLKQSDSHTVLCPIPELSLETIKCLTQDL